jgi:uridine kinase
VTERAAVLEHLAAHLDRDPGHPLRVGIDGVCGAGKSRFADELAAVLAGTGRPVVRLDSDGFHHPSAHRRRNPDPARGYYEDAFDFAALAERVLRPLGPGGDRRYAVAVHDLATDAVREEWAVAEPDAVVVLDCTFLQRGALRALWDEVVYLDVDLERATARGVARDAAALGGREAAAEAYRRRYRAACEIYLAEERPRERASVVIAHDDVRRPVVVRPDLMPPAAR